MARIVLAALLLAMAAGQALDVPGFVDVIETYGIGGEFTAWPLALGLIAAELFGGVGLLLRPALTRRRAAVIALGTAIVWSVLGTQAFARGLVLPNCGCFGVHLTQPLRWWVLVQDLEFMALGWWVLRRLPEPDSASEPAADPTRLVNR